MVIAESVFVNGKVVSAIKKRLSNSFYNFEL